MTDDGNTINDIFMVHFIKQQDADFFFGMEKFPEEEMRSKFTTVFINLITLVTIITVALSNLITL